MRWHYSRAMPVGKAVRFGVWEDGRFIGCVLFGRGANRNMGSFLGLTVTEVAELTRIALTDHRAPVSQIMAVAVRLLRRCSPDIRALVSYADPAHGHHGGVYQAAGWVYTGASATQASAITVNGERMHKRTVTAAFGTASVRRLREQHDPQAFRGPPTWKHRYVLPLDVKTREKVRGMAKPAPLPTPTSTRDTRAAAASVEGAEYHSA